MIVIIYMLVFCLLAPISVYLLVRHHRNSLVFWGAITLLFAGLSGLQVVLEHLIIPYFSRSGMSSLWIGNITWISDKLNSTIHSVPYWSILLFFLHYAGFMNKYFIAILPIPVWISIWNPKIEGVTADTVNYPFILAWGIPYALTSGLLFLYVLFKEKNRAKLPRHLRIGAIYLVPEAALILYQSDGWYLSIQANLLVCLSLLLVLSALLVTTSYLRNTFLNVNREAFLGKMYVGTRLMQHAFKNAAGKIKLGALNVRRSLNRQNYEEADKQLDYLLAANNHLLGMLDKLSYITYHNTSLTLESHDLRDVVYEVASPFLANTNVVFRFPDVSAVVRIDKALVVECLTNVINNALEAMGGTGMIQIGLHRKKTRIALSVADSGPGMDALQLASATEPFYSTKVKSGRNFGLGLYYVQKVMNAHRGKLHIASQSGQGTCVTLEFPMIKEKHSAIATTN